AGGTRSGAGGEAGLRRGGGRATPAFRNDFRRWRDIRLLEVDVRLEAVRERIAAAAERAGRDPGEVTLIAVTKTVDVERITAVLRQGVEHIGENRVQEAEEKFPRLTVPCTKHLIGRLQRNKVGKALELFDLIHSVDRIPLVERLAQRAAGRQ